MGDSLLDSEDRTLRHVYKRDISIRRLREGNMDKRRRPRDFFARELHWWDDHPPADPENEPLYAEALQGHLAQVS